MPATISCCAHRTHSPTPDPCPNPLLASLPVCLWQCWIGNTFWLSSCHLMLEQMNANYEFRLQCDSSGINLKVSFFALVLFCSTVGKNNWWNGLWAPLVELKYAAIWSSYGLCKLPLAARHFAVPPKVPLGRYPKVSLVVTQVEKYSCGSCIEMLLHQKSSKAS